MWNQSKNILHEKRAEFLVFSAMMLIIILQLLIASFIIPAGNIPVSGELLILLVLSMLLIPIVRNLKQKDGNMLENIAIILLSASGFFLHFTGIFSVLFILSLIFFWIFRIRRQVCPQRRKSDLLLFLFLLSALVSGLLSAHKGEGIGSVFLFLVYILTYFHFRGKNQQSKDVLSFIYSIAFAMVGWGIFTALHFLINRPIDLTLFGHPVAHFVARDPSYNLMISIFQYSSFGGYLVTLAMILTGNFLLSQWTKLDIKSRALFIAALSVGLLTVILTMGRGALLILGIAFVIFSLAYRKRILLGSGLALALILVLLPIPKIQRTLDHLKTPAAIPNLEGRLTQYKAAEKIFLEKHTLFGVGLANFKFYYQKQFPADYHNVPVDFVHDLYLGILVETGALGWLILFGWLIWYLIRHLLFRQKNQQTKALDLLGLIMIVSLLTVSFFDALFYNAPLGLLFWMGFGLGESHFSQKIT